MNSASSASLLEYMPLYIPCGISFAADFFTKHIGSKYTEEVMLDPIKRWQQSQRQHSFLLERYPTFYEGKSPKKNPSLGIGVATIPKCWGCKVKFHENMDPIALPLLNKGESVFTLRKPDLDEGMHWLYEEIDAFLDAGCRKSEIGLPDLQGPLNISMKLVGDSRMLSLIARKNKEEEVRYILDIASDVYIEVRSRLLKALGRPVKSSWTVTGCTYYYLRPPQWEKYVKPVIEKCMVVLGTHVGLHHCGKATTEMVETYAKIQWVRAEFGFGSDLKRARELYIHPKMGPIGFSCRISPYRMLNQGPEQIARDVESIISQIIGGPAAINVVGCPADTPEENLWALWNAVQAYNKKKEEEEM